MSEITMHNRRIRKVHVEDVQLVALDKECFELLIYCGRQRRRGNEVARFKRLYRCCISDDMLEKLDREIRSKHLTSAELASELSEEDSE